MLFYNVEVVNVILRVKGKIRGKEEKKKLPATVQGRKERKKRKK
jgi:hypothetical protein